MEATRTEKTKSLRIGGPYRSQTGMAGAKRRRCACGDSSDEVRTATVVDAAPDAPHHRAMLAPSSSFQGIDPDAARAFAARWLPAWTGNDPERLAAFYTDDAVYLDPAIPGGVRGKAALVAYFTRLLRRNPSWVWTQREAIPMADGFVNLWHASVPMGDVVHEIDGVCLVVLRDGVIARNEVYFDRSALMAPPR